MTVAPAAGHGGRAGTAGPGGRAPTAGGPGGAGARGPVALAVALALALVVAGAACDGGTRTGARPGRPSATTTAGPASSTPPPAPPPAGAPGDTPAVEVPVGDHGRGGSARVGVWAAPDPAAPTLGGAAVRALVLPQLFVARPDGRWSPALVDPGSDRLAADRRSASFRLRPGATWSDGTPIGIEDLRRTADGRFVAGLEGPAEDGTITVAFTQELPGWRRLWSVHDSVGAPREGVWGGPFVVSAATPGLETVLARNERWWGPKGPFLDEVRLVLVPDSTTARLLLARGDLDVVMPPAATARRRQLEAVARVSVDEAARGGWSMSLRADPDRLAPAQRRALFATVDRGRFVATLLAGEAFALHGFAGPEDATWAGVGPGDAGALTGRTVDLVGLLEEPMTYFLHRSMQRRAEGVGGRIELRQTEADRFEGWLAGDDYAAALVLALDPPGGCWRCRWEHVDAALATAADAGDPAAAAALQARLRDGALVLPLWAPRTVLAWRAGLSGPRANGYAHSAAWNAWEWWRDP